MPELLIKARPFYHSAELAAQVWTPPGVDRGDQPQKKNNVRNKSVKFMVVAHQNHSSLRSRGALRLGRKGRVR